MRPRRHSAFPAFRALLAIGILICGISRAHAQAELVIAPRATFNTQTFRPTLGIANLFTVEGTLMPRQRWPIAGLVLEFANRPLRLVLQDSRETYAATVPATFTAHFMAGAGITTWLSAALALPVVFYQGFDTRTPTSDVPNSPTVAGLGDLRLLTKFHLLSKKGFGLAAVPQLTFPTGSAGSFRSDNTFGIEPRLAADYRFQNGIFIAANLGVYIRTYNRTVDFDLVRVSDHLRYGIGLGIPLPKDFMISGEVNGAVGFSQFIGGPLYTPLEWYVGARYAIKKGFEVNAGGGGGLVGAVGSPNFRGFVGATYVLPGAQGSGRPAYVERPKPPRDGSATDSDTPVIAPESCADAATAKDRVKCPDGDNDGVPDKLDACPTQPGSAEHSGCPAEAPDADKDGVADKVDRCPNEPGPAANSGCPDRDQDKDGIVDRLDKCPKLPGPKESAGCPLLEVGEASIRLALPLKFQPGSAELDTESRPTIAALVTTMRATPTIKKVLIDVTAGGSHHAAKKLATRRAKALSDLLVEAGASLDVLAIRAVSEPGPDQIARVDLVRDANLAKPEASKPEASKPEASKPEASKPEASKPEASKPEASKPDPARPAAVRPTRKTSSAAEDAEDGDNDSDRSSRHHRSHRSHSGQDGKSRKSNKEKRGHH